MASTYVNDLRLNEMATGDQSGSWGTVTNTNLELIGEAFSYGTEAITTNADTHTTTISDGATAPGRAMFLKYTGTLDSACTITIGPNTVNKMWFIENATTGSQNIIISQGSGANITIAAGQTKAVYSDGAGAGAAFVDAFAALDVGSLAIAGTLVTSTAAELNILDGVTATAAELNILDGVTATAAEINILDGVTATTAELNILVGVTATAAEINILDGVTATAAEINILDGVTATAAEINILDGVTATAAELNYNDITTLGTVEASKTVTADASGDVLFPDDDKAIFGAGSDLQIYHDGSNSIIHDNGTGNLNIRADDFNILNAGATETKIAASSNGAVTLYYDNASKLATSATGVTVTGTVAATAYTGDGSALTGIVTGSLTSLGTLTTTSGNTQTLSSLTLTSYKQVMFVIKYVSHGNLGADSNLRLGAYTGGVKLGDNTNYSNDWNGWGSIDLATGVVWCLVGIFLTDVAREYVGAYSGSGMQTDITTASTGITFSLASGTNFDKGTIYVYGVRSLLMPKLAK
jgi:hypothetical protein